MVSFCCAQHGPLSDQVKYISIVFGNRTLADFPIVYCKKCKKYYTPYTNLLAFAKPKYKGIPIVAAESHVEKSFPRTETRIPHFIASEKVREPQGKKEKYENKGRKKNVSNAERLRKVDHCDLILTNKPCFTIENLCPHCNVPTQKEAVRINKGWKVLTAKIRHCEVCDADYITPAQFYAYNEKIQKRAREQTGYSFVEPQNVKCECDDDNRYLFIPKWMLYSSKFDEYNLPPRDDEYYDLTDEEYLWVKMSYGPEKFNIDLRQQSLLGAAGYSTGESEIRRHSILAKCVHEYGKGKVIRQLKVNINLRAGQKKKNFGNAINIWRGDIWYVEHKL